MFWGFVKKFTSSEVFYFSEVCNVSFWIPKVSLMGVLVHVFKINKTFRKHSSKCL